MQKGLAWIFFGVWVLGGMACSKNRPCEEPDGHLGWIQAPAPTLCLPAKGSEPFVIRDEASYQLVFPSDECRKKLAIDFSRYSLLGFLVSDQGCSVRFTREVIMDRPNFPYIYTVKTVACGNCSEERISYNWVIVPRLLPDWTVKFIRP